MPRHLGGGDFADARLVSVALMIGLPGDRLAAAALGALSGAAAVPRPAGRDHRGLARACAQDRGRCWRCSTMSRRARAGRRGGGGHCALGARSVRPHRQLCDDPAARAGQHPFRGSRRPHAAPARGSPGFADPSHRMFVAPGTARSGGLRARARGRLAVVHRRPAARPAARRRGAIYRAQGTLLARLAKPPAAR